MVLSVWSESTPRNAFSNAVYWMLAFHSGPCLSTVKDSDILDRDALYLVASSQGLLNCGNRHT